MIAKLKGLIDMVGEDSAIIMVGGVGYLVFCSTRTLQTLIRDQEVTLVIETYVREDCINLYGFLSETEREMFRLLTSTQGVGMKMGLAILSALSLHAIEMAILSGDKQKLTCVSGVGVKLAQRLINEVKDKLVKLKSSVNKTHQLTENNEFNSSESSTSDRQSEAAELEGEHRVNDIVSALINLGYGQSDAFLVAMKAVKELGSSASEPDLIRFSLKEITLK